MLAGGYGGHVQALGSPPQAVGVPLSCTSRGPPTGKGVGLPMDTTAITRLGERDTFAHNFAFSQQCFHAENSIKTNSTVTA